MSLYNHQPNPPDPRNQQPPHKVPSGLDAHSYKKPGSGTIKLFPTSISLSTGAHIVPAGLFLLTIFIMQFLGFKIPFFEPLDLKPRDIEFVLVDNPPQPPRDKNTKNRAEHATRSGGEKTSERTVEPQRAAGSPNQAKPQPARPTQKPKPKVVQKATPKPTPRANPKPTPKKPTRKAAPQPKVPKRTKVASKSPSLPPRPVAPSIKTPMPNNPGTVSRGPIASTSGPVSTSRGSGNPGPSQVPGFVSRPSPSSTGSRGSSGGQRGSGGSGRFNQSGSPGGGGGRPGIDALPEPDFGPYMAELKRRIKRNWHPPHEDRSKTVVAIFTISKNGRLLNVRIIRGSNSKVADDAAIAAVRASAPFRPLPANYRDSTVDIEFTFDYDVSSSVR